MALFKKKSKKLKNNDELAKIGDELDFFSLEAYNAIRTNLALSFHGKKKGKVIGITSATPGDGKSLTSINIAYALAKDGNSVLLIGGDLRRPSLELKLGIKPGKGLSNFLCGDDGEGKKIAVFKGVLHENLNVLAAGEIPPNPSELLGSHEMKSMLEGLRTRYNYIVIDLPPITSVIDAISVSPYLDGMVVVVRHGITNKKTIRKAMEQLEYANVKILGFVYNGAKVAGKGYKKDKYDTYAYQYSVKKED